VRSMCDRVSAGCIVAPREVIGGAEGDSTEVTMCSEDVPPDFYERIRARLYRRIGRELSVAHRVLDLGCGSCELVRYLRKSYGQRVTGVDISDGKMPRRDDPSRSRAPMRCIKSDGARLEFLRDGSVDAVVTTWALHEMDRPSDVVAEGYRVLRPGGKMIIVDFPRGSLAQRLWDEDYLTASEARSLLTEAGFERVRARTIHDGQVIWAVGFRPAKTMMDA
jgi:ubiquinone/menaquinone biosynthesis C-methylase UbiE